MKQFVVARSMESPSNKYPHTYLVRFINSRPLIFGVVIQQQIRFALFVIVLDEILELSFLRKKTKACQKSPVLKQKPTTYLKSWCRPRRKRTPSLTSFVFNSPSIYFPLTSTKNKSKPTRNVLVITNTQIYILKKFRSQQCIECEFSINFSLPGQQNHNTNARRCVRKKIKINALD